MAGGAFLMAKNLRPRRSRLLLLGLLTCGLAAGLAVALAGALWWAGAFQESPETRQLRARLETADAGWHNIEVRTRIENGEKVTFAAGTHPVGSKSYNFMLLRHEGVGGVAVEVENAGQSRLVARWVPPAEPSQTLPDTVISQNWGETKQLMRQLLEAFEETLDRHPPQ
jgi:hypothetical protein